MRGKSAAAAPFSGATVQLAGSSGYFICFLQLFAAEKQQKPLRPITRAAACGPVAASGDHAGLPANRPRRFPPPGHKLLLLPRDIVGRILFTSTHKRGQSQRPFFSIPPSFPHKVSLSPAFRRRKAAKAAPACHAGGCLRPGCGVGRPYGFASKPSPTLSAPRPQASSSPS
jgi:hypothetical protein